MILAMTLKNCDINNARCRPMYSLREPEHLMDSEMFRWISLRATEQKKRPQTNKMADRLPYVRDLNLVHGVKTTR